MSSAQFLSNCSADAISSAAKKLRAGALIAFPTETVYGLGADAENPEAVSSIYSVKGRPADHPLIVHIASMHDMGDWAKTIPDYAITLARSFWPGPMTLIFKRTNLAKDFITGGQDTVGIRVPNHTLALALLNEFKQIGGHGIAAPSANRFGQVSPTTADAVQEELGEYLSAEDLILDGGPCLVGVESTIIDCTSNLPRILRPGAITEEMIEDATGLEITQFHDFNIRVSGSLENHYAPNAKVFLDRVPLPGEGFIALSEIPTPFDVIRLASPKSVDEYAQVLYSALRDADLKGITNIVVASPDGEGLAIAIRDRLGRAANETIKKNV